MRFFYEPVLMHFDKKKAYLKLDDFLEDNKSTEEKKPYKTPFMFYFYFFKTKSYVINKIKKKGRIKRKITRKLFLSQGIVD